MILWWTGIWTSQSLVQEMISVLTDIPDSHPVWAQVRSNLSKVPIPRLQRFWICAKRHGFHGREVGNAENSGTRSSKPRCAAVSWGPKTRPGPCATPEGWAKSNTSRRAGICNLNFPNPRGPVLDLAPDAWVIFRPGIQQWRLEQENFLNAALETLPPLREATQPLRSFTTKSVPSTRDVAGIALFTALLRCPDRTQASGYLVGFKLVAEISQPQDFFAIVLVRIRVISQKVSMATRRAQKSKMCLHVSLQNKRRLLGT